MDFAKMKSGKNSSATIEKLLAGAEQSNNGGRKGQDDRLWKPTVDKMGNGYAVIRFLPSDSDLPWAKYWDHGFKGPTGQWLFEKSLTTLGMDCPISNMNKELWNSNDDDDKKIVRERKRRLHYVANILVLEDSANPEAEGKVFLYDFGKKIFDMIMDSMQPQYPDEKPMNPFDVWNGGDFVMKIRKVEGYRSYDKSEFRSPTELLGGDETKMEAVANKIYDLGEFTDPATFKSFDELQARLAVVLGEVAPKTVKAQVTLEAKADAVEPPFEAAPNAPEEPADNSVSADEEDPLSYFQKYAEGAAS
jgi:hypothetical protein